MSQKPSLKGILTCFLFLVASITFAASLFAYFGAYNENCELLTHFRFQYLLISIIFLATMIALKEPKLIAFAIGWFLYIAVPIFPYYLPQHQAGRAVGTHLKILQLNVLLDNYQHNQVIHLINAEKPDIIGLEEVQPHWATALKIIEKDYPYRIIKPDNSAFGIALYSKYPLSDPHIEHFGSLNGYTHSPIPSISALVHLDNQPVRLIVTHPFPPTLFQIRNSQLASMGLARKLFEENLILIGDLNTSPWSPYFKKLIQQTGLRDSELGFGVQPSWPDKEWLIRTPIDHILISKDIQVLNRHIGPAIGSDHFPVIAEVALGKK